MVGKERQRAVLYIRVTPRMKQRIAKACDATGKSQNALVVAALTVFLRSAEKKEPPNGTPES